MSTNRLFTLIVAAVLIAVVALVAPGMFASASRSSQAGDIRKLDSLRKHADALQGDVINQSSSGADSAYKILKLESMGDHADALQGDVSNQSSPGADSAYKILKLESMGDHVPNGAINQSSPQIITAEALRQLDLLRLHADALQEVAP